MVHVVEAFFDTTVGIPTDPLTYNCDTHVYT